MAQFTPSHIFFFLVVCLLSHFFNNRHLSSDPPPSQSMSRERFSFFYRYSVKARPLSSVFVDLFQICRRPGLRLLSFFLSSLFFFLSLSSMTRGLRPTPLSPEQKIRLFVAASLFPLLIVAMEANTYHASSVICRRHCGRFSTTGVVAATPYVSLLPFAHIAIPSPPGFKPPIKTNFLTPPFSLEKLDYVSFFESSLFFLPFAKYCEQTRLFFLHFTPMIERGRIYRSPPLFFPMKIVLLSPPFSKRIS